MAIETLGEAWQAGWAVYLRCDWGPRAGLKHKKPCIYGRWLEIETLVATRGRDFPIARLAERCRCPRCGSRRVRIVFDPTGQRSAAAAFYAAVESGWG